MNIPNSGSESHSLIHVSESNPCRHCSKPDWCYTLGDLEVCKRDCVADGWEATSKADGNSSVYLRAVGNKAVRLKQERVWHYPARDSKQLLKVVRTDHGNGKKDVLPYCWLGSDWAKKSGYKQHVKRENIPVYRYQAIRSAIANGKWVWVVEGEPCADALVALGLAATTNLGGSKKWTPSDTEDLRGATTVVLCPDRDNLGVQHMDAVAASIRTLLPEIEIKWLHAPPGSVWQRLPEGNGLDVADWIADNKLGVEAVLAEVEEMPRARAKSKTLKAGTNGNGNGNHAEKIDIADQARAIVTGSLTLVEQKAALMGLSRVLNRPLREIEAIAELVEDELERSEIRDEVAAEVDKLAAASDSKLDIHTILPSKMSTPLAKLANWQNIKPEVYMTTALTAVSALHKVGTKLILSEAVDFEVTPNLFTAIVAESSQKKSPILKALVYKPLNALQAQAREEFDEATAKYHRDTEEWNNLKGPERIEAFPNGKPKEPRQKVYYLGNTTSEGLARQMQAYPEQGLLYLKDELAGIFKSANQYRQGRGSDEEDLLSIYDGGGITQVRTSGVTVDIPETNMAMLGSIQPAVLKTFMNDCTDSNGKWARFIFVNQSLAPSNLPDGGGIGMNELLVDLYRKVDQLPARVYKLAPDSFKYFQKVYNKLELLRVSDSSQGMRSVWGKSEGRVGKLALNLHIIHSLIEGEDPPEYVPLARIVEAVDLTRFYAQQVKALHIQFADEGAIAPHLARIVELSKKKGIIKVRDVQRGFDSKSCPKPETIRSWFAELVGMGKGRTSGSGRSISFEFVEKLSANSSTDGKLTERDFEVDVEFAEFVDKQKEASGAIQPEALSTQSNSVFKLLQTNPTNRQTNSNLVVERVSKVENSPTANSTNLDKFGFSTLEPNKRVCISSRDSKFNGKQGTVEKVIQGKVQPRYQIRFDCDTREVYTREHLMVVGT